MVSHCPLARRVSISALIVLIFGAFFYSAPSVAAAPRQVLIDADRFLQKYEMVSLDPANVARKARGEGRLTIEAGIDSYDVVLEPRDLRAADYRAVETLEDGSTRELPAAPVNTFAGHLAGENGAVARFSIDDNALSGFVMVGGDRLFVEPLSTFSLAGGPTDYVVYRGSDIRPEAEVGACDDTAAGQLQSAVDGVAGKVSDAQGNGLTVVRLATDADNEFVSQVGSAQAANDQILSIMNQVDGVYEAEAGITFQIVLQNSYASADPYSPTTNSSDLLSEFRTVWNASHREVSRDTAHLWTGKDLDGSTIGLAYIGVVCRAPDHAYGLSQYNASVPQRYVLTAHELGHNLGACHANSDCNPNAGSAGVTIMNSIIGANFTFSEFSLGQIATHVANYGSCLGTVATEPPSTPTGLSATAVAAKRVELRWNGSSASGTEVERSAAGSQVWIRVTTAAAGTSSYVDSGVTATTTYAYRVRATNNGGTSQYSAETSVTTPSLVAPTTPQNLTATRVAPTSIALQWSANSTDADGYIVERSTDGTTFSEIARVAQSTTVFENDGLKKKGGYTYRVRAYNDAGESNNSNTAKAKKRR